MKSEKTRVRRGTKPNAFGFGPMGHGMSEMMKSCTTQGGFPDCLTMMEEMKKQCCPPHKDAAEPERTKK
jgi:hypothetical protein